MATEQDQNKQQPLPASLEQAAADSFYNEFTQWLINTPGTDVPHSNELKAIAKRAAKNFILNSLPATTVYVAVDEKSDFMLVGTSSEKSGYVKPIVIADIIGEKDKEIEALKKENDSYSRDCSTLIRTNNEKVETIKKQEQEIERLKGIVYGLEEGSENWKKEYDSSIAILASLVDVHGDRDATNQTISFAKAFLSKYQHL